MLRTWPTSSTLSCTALSTLSLLLACSSVGTPANTDAQGSDSTDDPGATESADATATPTTMAFRLAKIPRVLC